MKKNKNTLSIMEAVKQKAQEAKTETKPSQDEYISVIDYTEYELEKTEIEKIIKCEEKVTAYSESLKRDLVGLAEWLAQAQKIFANKKNGKFQKWFETIGLKKTFVYTLLSRQELFVEFNDIKIFQIPERVLPEIKKIKNKVSHQNIIEIINSDKPMDAVKNITFGSQTLYKKPNEEIIEDAEIINYHEEKNINLEEINNLRKEINIKEKELKELKKQLREKDSLEENKNNFTIDFKPLLSTKELLFLRNKEIEIDLDDYLLVDDLKINRWFDDALLNGLDVKDQLKDYIVTEKNIEVRIEYYKKIAELAY